MTKIAINGFGRIGRAAFRVALTKKNIKVVAINDLAPIETLANLLRYDTVYGKFPEKVSSNKKGIKVGNQFIPIVSEKEPANLPWKEYNVDVVLECTGFFTKSELAKGHLDAGAKKVIISAPAKDEVTQTLVYGTKQSYDCIKRGECNKIVSMASCTTNCISPAIQVLESAFGIEKALMTTIHAYTSTQNLVDGPHKDPRRGRAAAQNIVPTTTGAAIATTKVVPNLKGNFDGIAVRVPVPCGSLADITAVLKKKNVTVESINDAFKKAEKNPLFKGVLMVSKNPMVSSDYIGNTHSSIIDPDFTKVVGGNLVKILAWYDNEMAYSSKLVDMALSV